MDFYRGFVRVFSGRALRTLLAVSSVMALLLSGASLGAQQQYRISTFAGAVPSATGVALTTGIGYPQGVAADNSGNFYFTSLNSVFKVDSSGNLTRIAGNTHPGYAGDGGPATSAEFNNPVGVAVDSTGNLYVADQNNGRIRKISTSGTITTVAGNGGCCSASGDGGPATSAQLGGPNAVAVDSSGNLYIADTNNQRIRMVSTSGTITTVAGNGTYGSSGDNGPATSAELGSPRAVAVDSSGNIYIGDSNNNRIRKVSGGTITAFAGINGSCCYSGDGGPATSAQIGGVNSLAVDSAGNVTFTDGSSRVRRISSGTINTVAGTGGFGYSGDAGQATSALLSGASGVALDSTGNIYIADTYTNSRIRKVSAAGVISTVAGNGNYSFGGDGGSATSALLGNPYGVAVDLAGNLYIADQANQRIRKVSGGIVTTVTGNGSPGFSGDNGPAANAQVSYPNGAAVDTSGSLYIADTNNQRIRKISSGGTITTVAGNGSSGYSGDGAAPTSASMRNPQGVAVDASGNIYIADTFNYVVRKVSGVVITTVAGTGTRGYSGDNGPATSAQLGNVNGVALDSTGNLYIADNYPSYRIRKVSTAGTITTIAGNGSCCYSGDGGAATSANLNPFGIAVDAAGNVYITDGNHVRVVSASTGVIYTIAGGNNGYSGDGGPATSAMMSSNSGLAMDSSGNIYVADTGNNAIRLLTPIPLSIATTSLPVAGLQTGYSQILAAAGGNPPYTWSLSSGSPPAGLTLAANGTISGTPTATGTSSFTVRVTDSASATTTAGLAIIVNNPVPSIGSLGAVSAVAGSSGFTLTVNGSQFINGASSVQWNGSPRTTTLISGSQLTALITAADVASPGTFNVTVFNPTPGGGTSGVAPFTVLASCTYQISAASFGAPLSSATGSVGVLAPAGCSWTAASNSNFLTVTSGAAGNGTGTVGYSVAANSSGSTRSGTLTIAGQTFTVTQTVVSGPQYTISTYAGGIATASPAPALSTSIGAPQGIVTDATGNVYFASNYAVYKVDSGGTLYRIAGNNRSGATGDGGPAANAQLSANGLARDAAGNIYVADPNNNRIRKISPAGVITTYAGTGNCCYSGDGGPATSANLNNPQGVALDSSGNLYIADSNDNRIRMVTPSGTISTVAGNGNCCYSGDGGAATSAVLNNPRAVAVDSSGNLYIGDSSNHRIRKVSGGIITTIAGTGSCCYSGDGGPAISAQIQNPQALALDSSGNLYFADGSSRIRVISTSGTITTVAGGTCCALGDGGPATSASLSGAQGVAFDAAGNLYISDTYNNYRIRKVSGGIITTIAGNGNFFYQGDGGPAASTGLGNPAGVTVDASGNVYIADYSNNRVRKVASGIITTLAGTGVTGFSGDSGPAVNAQFNGPRALAFDSSGNLYVADANNARIRMISPSGTITTVAGNGCCYGGDGGAATSAQLNYPSGVAVDAAGNMYIADSNNNRIRKVSGGIITTFAGNGTYGYSGDGGPATSAELRTPNGVFVDSAGNVYIADSSNQRIRKVTTDGNIATIAGNGICCYSGDGGPATNAQLNFPTSVWVNALGNLFISDANGQRIRMVLTNDIITTLAGNGSGGYSGDGGVATAAQLNSPHGLALDSSGNIYVADQNNNVIRLLQPLALSLEVPTSLPGGSFSVPYSVSLIAAGGHAPYTFSLLSGALPGGLSLSASGTISGTPNATGVFSFTVKAIDSASASATASTAITINNPIPSITSLSAVSAMVGSSGFTFTVNGSEFVNGGSMVQWNGSPRSTTFVGTTQLTITINTADLASPGTFNVTVVNSTPGGGTSGTAPFTVVATCTYQLSPASFGAPLSSSTGSVGVLAPTGCSWTAASNSNFLTVTSGASGSGNGTVGYSVAANSSGSTRSGALTIGGQTFTVTQTIASGPQYTISTYAGGIGTPTPASAVNTAIAAPLGILADAAGNIYFSSNYAVYKVDSGGTLYRIAGNNRVGFAGDGGPAVNAQLSANALARDAAGNIYVADSNNNRVRKISPDGVITTYAGTGNCCFSGDGGAATSANLNNPQGVAVDSSGNLYIADSGDNRIRVVTPGGTISTVAGNGNCCYSGDGGAATSALLNNPRAVALDSSGNLYIGDSNNNRIRKVSGGIITTIAGTGTCCYSGDGGPATSAQIQNPDSLALDSSGNLYLADQSSRIRMISTSGIITTVAGNGNYGYSGDGGPAASAQLSGSYGVALDTAGNLYISDTYNNYRIRKVSNGTITTIAGNGSFFYSGDGGPAASAGLGNPAGLALDTSGNVYIADSSNNRVRKVASGIITTLAGTGVGGYGGDSGPAVSAQLNNPRALAVDSSGNVYVADSGNNRIRMVSPSGTITTVAGNGCCYGGDGGVATSAQLNNPQGVAVDASGNIYIADTNNQRIRKVSGGIITTFAGNGTYGYSGDGGPATSAELRSPSGVFVDSAGNVYIADSSNNRIRKVTTDGNIATIAGNGNCCYAGDGGPATSAQLNHPIGLWIDALGNLFISDTNSQRIRMVLTNGIITTIAGNGNSGYSGDGSPATAAQLNSPYGIALDSSGNIYVADQNNNAIRVLQPLALSLEVPNPLPGGSFSVPYSATVIAAGGHAPYTFSLLSGALPGGLSLSASGTISGTPNATGVFSFTVKATDSTSASGTAATSITIDNPIPSITSLSATSALAGSSGFTLTVNGSQFLTGVSSVQWNGSPRSTTFLNGSQLTALISASDLASPGTFNVTVLNGAPGGGASPAAPFTVVSACVFQVGPTSVNFAAPAANAVVAVYATSGCAWTAASNSSFLTITSGASGSGSGTAGYSVAANGASFRSGTLTIAGQTVTVTQSAVSTAVTPEYTISTIAGAGMPALPAAATGIGIGFPQGVVADQAGNVYFTSLNSVFRVDSGGTLTLVAGNLKPGFSGDGGPAVNAQLFSPWGLALDSAGDLYVSDSSNGRVRRISPNGIITTVAGGGSNSPGDGGPATSANISTPYGLAFDAAGNLYIATSASRVRMVTPSGVISTFAGTGVNGFSGDGGPAASAQFSTPHGLAFDSAGNLYVGDAFNYRVRKISSSGIINTYAGNGTCCSNSGDGGPATSASIQYSYGLAFDAAGNLDIADASDRIRQVSPAGIITTVAGNGNYGFSGDGGSATSASLSSAYGVALDSAGNVYIADENNSRIRKISPSGIISTFAGNGTVSYSGDNGPAINSQLAFPRGITADSAGNYYFADYYNQRVRKIAAAGTITTVAGTGVAGFSGDGGAAASAQLSYPSGVALDASGNLYIADTSNERIRKVDSSGNITTVAGNGCCFGGDGGPATSAQMNGPSAVTFDAAGNMYIADTNNSRIRKVSTSGTITTVAGNGTNGFSGDGGAATSAQLRQPQGVAVDAAGNLYIADTNNGRIRKVDTTGTISTLASLSSPFGLGIDSAGYLYAATAGNTIQRISPAGTVVTIAGTNSAGYSGDGGPALNAQLYAPYGVAAAPNGKIVIADSNNYVIRLLQPLALTIATTSLPAAALGQGYAPALAASGGTLPYAWSVTSGAVPAGLTLTSSGTFSGTATTLGTSTFTVMVTDGASATASASLSITVNNPVPAITGLDNNSALAGAASFTLTVYGSGFVGNSQVQWSGSPRTTSYTSSTQLTAAINAADIASAGSATITVANPTPGGGTSNGVPFTVVSGCTFQLAAGSVTFSSVALTSSVLVTGPAGCPWTAVANSAFLNVTGGASSSGTGTVTFTMAANTGGARAGTLTIAGLTFAVTQLAPYNISTFAGGNPAPTPAAATGASIGTANAVVKDSAGNVYFSSSLHAVYKIDTSGTLTRIAGTGRGDFSGDGGPAASAQLRNPFGLALDSSGNLYIADSGNGRIRRVDTSGNITTVAGNGNCCFGGDGGQATSAQMNSPYGVAVDSAGNLYIADTFNYRIRKVTTAGIISTIAGNGTCCFSGDGGAATSAQLNVPRGLAVDSSGNVYVADTSNNRIRMISTSGNISTVAGNGNTGFSGDGGTATSTSIYQPYGVAVDASGNVYIAEALNSRIRKVSGGIVTTVAGNGSFAYSGDGGAATSASMYEPYGVAVDSSGNIYIADAFNYRVRQVSTSGTITTIAGNGNFDYSGDGGSAASAQVGAGWGVVADSAGNVYIAEPSNHRVRKVAANGTVSTFAGTGVAGFGGDGGPATSALLNTPYALALDGTGNLYVSDLSGSRVRMIATNGTITTVAGNGSNGFSGDGGPAASATLSGPQGLVADSSGNLYIADTNNYRIRKVAPGGTITTVAGTGICCYNGDGGPATSAQINRPAGLALDAAGNLYIADTNNYRIRKVSPAGIITTVSGNGSNGFAADGSLATNTAFGFVYGIAVDSAGNLLSADVSYTRVRLMSPSGYLTTIAGGAYGYSGDGGLATNARIGSVYGVAVGPAGSIYLVNGSNYAVRLLQPATVAALAIATTSPLPAAVVAGAYSQTLAGVGGSPPYIWSVASGSLPAGLTLSAAGMISGTPTSTISATANFTITLTDSASTPASVSTPFSLTLNNAVPTTTGLGPASAVAGRSTSLTLTVSGTLFAANAAVQWNGSPRTTTYLSSTQLTATILSSDFTTAGTATVTVVNPAPGGGTSNGQTFTISGTSLLSTAPAGGAPGATIHVPVHLDIAGGVSMDSLAFTVTVTPNSTAPAITANLQFSANSALSLSPTVTPGASPNIATIAIASSTVLTGSVYLGDLLVTFPASATVLQTYTIAISSTSAKLATASVSLNPALNATLTVGGTYLVGDAYPYSSDTAPNFGDGLLNTLDLITALRAVTNLPGFRPAACSDRFDAMDSYPADGSSDPTILAGRPGGDGLLDTRDLIVTLRRVTNIDTSRPIRSARGLSCGAATAPQSRNAAATPAEGSLEFGTPVANGTGGWRIPVRLGAKVDLDLLGLSFSAGYDSASSSTQLNFVAAGKAPGLMDRNVPGKIVMAWLEGWQAKAGQVVEMGYLETPMSAESLRIYGVSANAVSGGRAVAISLPRQYRRAR